MAGMNPKFVGLVSDVANRLNQQGLEAAAWHVHITNTIQQGLPKPTVPVLDTIIRITRPVRPIYPHWVKKVLHPELEDVGLGEYDLATIDLWLHDRQRNGARVEGNRIYEDLTQSDSLKTCLGLRDGREIQKKGIAVFRQFFGGKGLFLWKSAILTLLDHLNVPCLCEHDGEVVVIWHCLGYCWNSNYPAARFAS